MRDKLEDLLYWLREVAEVTVLITAEILMIAIMVTGIVVIIGLLTGGG